MALDLLQAGFMSFRFSIYDKYLDANALPFESISNDPDKYPCSESGTVLASYTRAAGEEHKKGDTFSLQYDKCDIGDGFVHTGSVKGKYLSIEGYNKGFTDLTLAECVAIFTEEFEPDRIIQEDAYDMAVFNEGPNVVVQYLDFNSGSNTNEVRSRYELTSQEVALVINSSADAAAPYYFIENLKAESLDCQGYERRLELDIKLETKSVDGATEFELTDPIDFGFKGLVAFYQSPAFGSEQGIMEAERLDIYWNQNQKVKESSYKDLVVNFRSAGDAESFRFNTSGELNLQDHGILEINTPESVQGYKNELYPSDGRIGLLGKVPSGTGETPEQIRVDFFDTYVSVLISPDGDETGNGLADFPTQADLLWDDFWNRNFVFAEN
jgi:hypothetical protein